MTDNRFEDNWGSAAYGLLLKEIKDSRIEGNLLPGTPSGSSPRAWTGWSVERNQFLRNGWALRLMADADRQRLPPEPVRGQHLRRGDQQPGQQPEHLRRELLGRVRRLRPRSRRLRRRAVPSGAPVLGAGGAERAAADPAAQLLPRPAGCGRAADARHHARGPGGRPPPHAVETPDDRRRCPRARSRCPSRWCRRRG